VDGIEPLRAVVEDLIGALHRQAKELERLVTRIEQVTGHLGGPDQLSVIASEFSALHVRARKLADESEPEPQEM
jgi:hypothetical protein